VSYCHLLPLVRPFDQSFKYSEKKIKKYIKKKKKKKIYSLVSFSISKRLQVFQLGFRPRTFLGQAIL
jgi:hypothetical protein